MQSILWYPHNFQCVQNSVFYNGKVIFLNSFLLINTQNLRNLNTSFITLNKFEIDLILYSALLYVNSSFYFQQKNSNWGINFFNSSIDSKWRFLNIGCMGHLFIISMKNGGRLMRFFAILWMVVGIFLGKEGFSDFVDVRKYRKQITFFPVFINFS